MRSAACCGVPRWWVIQETRVLAWRNNGVYELAYGMTWLVKSCFEQGLCVVPAWCDSAQTSKRGELAKLGHVYRR